MESDIPNQDEKVRNVIKSKTQLSDSKSEQLAINLQLEQSAQVIVDSQYEQIDSDILETCPTVEPTSIALHLCKKKVLKPYFRVLSLLGWRPIIHPFNSDTKWYARTFNWFYALFVTFFILSGYVLQYTSCFRQDGYPPYLKTKMIESVGNNSDETNSTENSIESTTYLYIKRRFFNNNHQHHDDSYNHPNHILKCSGNFITLYLIPDILHFFAYLFVLQLMRTPECERLQNLLERVFLQAMRFNGWPLAHKKIVRTLSLYLWVCLGWVSVSLFGHILHIIAFQEICFTWIQPKSKLLEKIMTGITVMSLTWNDIICAAIIINYSIHCHLNISLISNLCSLIREKAIDFQVIRAINDIYESICYNDDFP